ITYHDIFLPAIEDKAALAPDLVISFGKSIISKFLKLFLRKTEAAHWHIQPADYAPDTFQRLSRYIQTSPLYFLQFLQEHKAVADTLYYNSWTNSEDCIKQQLERIVQQAGFGEYKALHRCLQQLPKPSIIHLANSMPVRYANYIGIRNEQREVVCNRGTSGIDGSNSTAVGCTFTTKDPVVLITGDMAFF